MSKVRLSFVLLVYLMKCSITETHSSVVHRDELARPSVPVDAPLIICCLNFFLGKIITGGTDVRGPEIPTKRLLVLPSRH